VLQSVQLVAPTTEEYFPVVSCARQLTHVGDELAEVLEEYLPAAHAVRVTEFGQ